MKTEIVYANIMGRTMRCEVQAKLFACIPGSPTKGEDRIKITSSPGGDEVVSQASIACNYCLPEQGFQDLHTAVSDAQTELNNIQTGRAAAGMG